MISIALDSHLCNIAAKIQETKQSIQMSSTTYIFRPVMLMYPFIIMLMTALFIGFHYLANQVPQDFLAQKLGSDFRGYNLSKHNYPFSAYGSHSILSNIGQNQYTECAVLLSVLSTEDKGIRNAVLPRTIVHSDNQSCALLEKVTASIRAGDIPKTQKMRTRYWWGARPVYSVFLRYFSVYEAREIIRNATALAYMALAIALFSVSPVVFWLSSPLLVFGTLFSGITYYSEVILGIPYLWAIVAASLLAALHAARISLVGIYLAIFSMGMVSSYLWLLDGHLILLFSWMMMIGYFASTRSMDSLAALKVMFKHLIAFSSGFIAAATSGQLVKAMYLGMDSVWKPLSTAIMRRSSNLGPGDADLNLTIVFDKVWGIGYWWTGLFRNELLWSVMLWSSVVAAVLGLVIGFIRGVRGERKILYAMLTCLLIVLLVLARLVFLKNHSVIHAFFIGRYMFIPLAMGWVVLLLALFGVGKPNVGVAKGVTK